MIVYDAILLTLHANDELLGSDRLEERPIGRTAMQKLVYFEAQRIPNELYFKAYYYGPFSPNVSEGLARLGAFGFVREDIPDGDGLAYEYHLTRDGRRLAVELAETKEYYGTIKDIVEIAAKHCNLRQLALAYAGKTHFLRKKSVKGNPRISEIAAYGKHFGWTIEEKDVKDGLKLLRALKLA